MTLTCHVPIGCRFQPPEAAATSAEKCGAAATHSDYTFTNVILIGVPCQTTAANDDNKCLEHSFASLILGSVSIRLLAVLLIPCLVMFHRVNPILGSGLL